ncbi:glutamate racemase [Eubacterium infirmum F0142]|nr:glutamate racemase [Eubacterium infirmum F0142]
MDNRPIGFFDSGVGGVTTIPHIMRMLSNESIIFFGDTARTPYGSKSAKTIRQFTLQIGEFLRNNDVKMIVIACNTVSSTALELLRKTYTDIPIVGCITPTAKEVVKICDKDSRIGIMATKATVKSGVYEDKIKSLNKELFIKSIACPALVPLIEEGIIDNEIMDLTLRYYLDDFIKKNDINTLILGCTHYPLISKNLKRLYPDIKIFSSSKEVATAVKMELEAADILSDNENAKSIFYASDLSENFVNMIERILGRDSDELNIKFKNLDI